MLRSSRRADERWKTTDLEKINLSNLHYSLPKTRPTREEARQTKDAVNFLKLASLTVEWPKS